MLQQVSISVLFSNNSKTPQGKNHGIFSPSRCEDAIKSVLLPSLFSQTSELGTDKGTLTGFLFCFDLLLLLLFALQNLILLFLTNFVSLISAFYFCNSQIMILKNIMPFIIDCFHFLSLAISK